ncbi:MAG: hypothetical protein ACLRI8_00170 [Agathobacter rectalis]
MMRAAWSSVADMAIVPMQDLLGLDSKLSTFLQLPVALAVESYS